MGLDILEMVVENLFDLLVDRLFHYPENIPQEITTVFREVDSLCCEEKARQLFQILRSRKSCFPCLPTKKLDNPGVYSIHSYNLEFKFGFWVCVILSVHSKQPVDSCWFG